MSADEREDEAAAADPTGGEEPGSSLLESAARERGLRVRRLAGDLVVCEHGQRRVAFRGLAGSRSGTVAHALCGNAGWLRPHLARRGLPVPATRLLEPSDVDLAQRAAEELGFPVTVRTVAGSVRQLADDPAAFHDAWRAVVETSPDRLLLERSADGEPIDVAVVGGRAVATAAATDPPADTGPLAQAAQSLAVRAVAALPGIDYGSVRGHTGAGGLVIDTIDPFLHTWSISEAGPRVATAILDLEFDVD